MSVPRTLNSPSMSILLNQYRTSSSCVLASSPSSRTAKKHQKSSPTVVVDAFIYGCVISLVVWCYHRNRTPCSWEGLARRPRPPGKASQEAWSSWHGLPGAPSKASQEASSWQEWNLWHQANQATFSPGLSTRIIPGCFVCRCQVGLVRVRMGLMI